MSAVLKVAKSPRAGQRGQAPRRFNPAALQPVVVLLALKLPRRSGFQDMSPATQALQALVYLGIAVLASWKLALIAVLVATMLTQYRIRRR